MTKPHLMGAALAVTLATLTPAQVLPGDETNHQQYHRRLQAIAAEGQPGEGDNALALLEALGPRMAAAETRVAPGGDRARVDYSALEDPGADAEKTRLAREALAALEADGVSAGIARIAAAPRAVLETGTGPLLNVTLPQTGPARHIARINRARALESLRAGDQAAAVERWHETLAVGRRVASSPIMIATLTGVAIQLVAFDAIRQAVAAGALGEGALAVLHAAVERTSAEPLGRAFRGELTLALDATDHAYARGAGALRGAPGKTPVQPLKATPGGIPDDARFPGLPRRGEQAGLFRRIYVMLEREAAMTAAERAAARGEREVDVAKLAAENPLVGLLVPASEQIAGTFDRWRAERAGVRALIAIERYRLAHGAEPASLDALVPALLPEVPRDPFTGGPLGYAPPGKGPEGGLYAGGRRFLLYAAGPDLKDDAGASDPKDRTRVLRPGVTGLDLILNDAPPAGR